ncbi:hypothetical protein CRG98_014314 [Punica granatum]|uniref:Uncharacterized protein n=1 Tax=Punica granatum TaxID=22663 RepID=A0A2I0KBY1_PUNGR|nr:hypothetical protein CRG98_014314 [Punica granatum]
MELRKRNEGSGLPIDDPDHSIEVAGSHRGCRRPRWRGRGSRLANSESTDDSELEVPGRFEVGAANRRPRPIHRGRRYPRRTPTTLVEGSGSPIGGPNPESIEDFELEVLD